MKKSLKLTAAILIILLTLWGCAKEAKFYEYTGPMPFENSEGIKLGMSLEEVEAVVG